MQTSRSFRRYTYTKKTISDQQHSYYKVVAGRFASFNSALEIFVPIQFCPTNYYWSIRINLHPALMLNVWTLDSWPCEPTQAYSPKSSTRSARRRRTVDTRLPSRMRSVTRHWGPNSMGWPSRPAHIKSQSLSAMHLILNWSAWSPVATKIFVWYVVADSTAVMPPSAAFFFSTLSWMRLGAADPKKLKQEKRYKLISCLPALRLS